MGKPSTCKWSIFCSLKTMPEITFGMISTDQIWLQQNGLEAETLEYARNIVSSRENMIDTDIDALYAMHREADIAYYKDSTNLKTASVFKLGVLCAYELAEAVALLQLLSVNGPVSVDRILKTGSVERQVAIQRDMLQTLATELTSRGAFPGVSGMSLQIVKRLETFLQPSYGETIVLPLQRLQERYNEDIRISPAIGSESWEVTTDQGTELLGQGRNLPEAVLMALTNAQTGDT